MPKASSRTLASTARQLVVHEAFDTTMWRAGSNSLVVDPRTKVTSAPLDGADTTTRGAPASRCPAARSRAVNLPGGLDHDVHAELVPGQRLHLGLGQQADAGLAHHHVVAVEGHRHVEAAEDRVPGEQAGEGRRRPQVVHGRPPRGRAPDAGRRAAAPVPSVPNPLIPTRTDTARSLPRKGTRPSAPATTALAGPTPPRSRRHGRSAGQGRRSRKPGSRPAPPACRVAAADAGRRGRPPAGPERAGSVRAHRAGGGQRAPPQVGLVDGPDAGAVVVGHVVWPCHVTSTPCWSSQARSEAHW